MSNNNTVDKLLKKTKNTLTSKPKTKSQTQGNKLVGTALDQRDSMVTDAPDVGLCHHGF